MMLLSADALMMYLLLLVSRQEETGQVWPSSLDLKENEGIDHTCRDLSSEDETR